MKKASTCQPPMQHVVQANGVKSFRANAIVRALLERSGLALDRLSSLGAFSQEDHVQFAQLLGHPIDAPRFDAIRSDLPKPVTLKKRGYQPHPMQPVILIDNVLRFRKNEIVRALLDRDSERGRVYPEWPARTNGGLNWVAMQNFSQEDQEQLAQLIGYSISGYHELSYVSDESAEQASTLAKHISPRGGGCRDKGCPIHGGPNQRTVP